jgi:protein gp37
MAETAIEWATHVWNPVTGCDRVSPGCAHCYALTYAARLKAMGQRKYQRDGGRTSGPGFGVTLHPDALLEPAGWRKRRRVFVNSMSDLFHEEIPTLFVGRVLDVIAKAPAHDFLVLTKRPERMRDLLNAYYSPIGSRSVFGLHEHQAEPLPNLWLGVSIENRRFVGRADLLRDTPAAVRFISAEPLLGPLLRDGFADNDVDGGHSYWTDGYTGPDLDLREIDWLIVGGESGPGYRPVRTEWIRDLRDACWHGGRVAPEEHGYVPTGTAFFFKQVGGRTPKAGGRELDGRTWDELPARARREAVAA